MLRFCTWWYIIWITNDCPPTVNTNLSNNFDVMIKLISRLDFIRNFMIKNEVKDFFLPQSMANTKFGIFVLNLVSRVQKKHLFYHLATGYNAPFCTLWYKIWIRGECPPCLDSNFCIPFELSNEVFFSRLDSWNSKVSNYRYWKFTCTISFMLHTLLPGS